MRVCQDHSRESCLVWGEPGTSRLRDGCGVKQYSKGRTTGSRIFTGDSEDKERHATGAIENSPVPF